MLLHWTLVHLLQRDITLGCLALWLRLRVPPGPSRHRPGVPSPAARARLVRSLNLLLRLAAHLALRDTTLQFWVVLIATHVALGATLMHGDRRRVHLALRDITLTLSLPQLLLCACHAERANLTLCLDKLARGAYFVLQEQLAMSPQL